MEREDAGLMYHPIKSYTTDDVDLIAYQLYRAGKVLKNDDGDYLLIHAQALSTPWLFKDRECNAECAYWHNVACLFGKGTSFIPSYCLNCWKVVIKPRNLDELYQIWGIIERLNCRGKCGIETRAEVAGLYGGYLYAHSLEEGRENYQMMYNEVRWTVFADLYEDEVEQRLILKRACTEYEMGHGPSDKWSSFNGQDRVENHIINTIKLYTVNHVQSEDNVREVRGAWNRFAHAGGDMTYLKYNNGELIVPPYVTYHK